LSALCLLFVAASPFYRRLTNRLAHLMLIGLALLGTLPAVAQFFAVRPLLDQAYGWPTRPGWGLWVMIVGFAFVIVAAGGT